MQKRKIVTFILISIACNSFINVFKPNLTMIMGFGLFEFTIHARKYVVSTTKRVLSTNDAYDLLNQRPKSGVKDKESQVLE